MRRFVQLLVLLVLAASLVLPATAIGQQEPTLPADGELALVVDVIDGDTIRIERENGDIDRVRYIGIDTPELANDDRPAEPYGPQATVANARFVEDQIVVLETDTSDRDRYDRLLRYVWVETEDGRVMVNERLVALGLAEVKAYEPDTKYHQYFLESQEQARSAGRGMHGEEARAGDLVGAEAMAYLFTDAYDARDAATIGQLLSDDVVYTLPGPERFRGKKDVLARFRQEWEELEPVLTIRGSIAQPGAAALELTIEMVDGESIEAVAVQRWADDRLVDYRLYRDE